MLPISKSRSAALAGVFACGIAFAGCSATVTKHGHLFQETDLQQIQPGMSAEQVRLSLGSPTTTSTAGNGQAFYYMSSTMKETSLTAPKETDRQVVAVYFGRAGTVERVANYGMKDGKVFDTISRTTPSANTNDDGILKSLFRNLGQKGSIFGDG